MPLGYNDLINFYAQNQRPSGFENFNQNIGKSIGDFANIQREKQSREQAFSDMLRKATMEQQIKQQDPMYQFLMSQVSGGNGGVNPRTRPTAQPQSRPQVSPVGMSTGGFVPRQFSETMRPQKEEQPFVTRPSFSMGEGGKVSMGISQVTNPKYMNPKQESLDKQRGLLASTRIRQEFINRPEIKDYVTVSTNVKSMDSFLKKALASKDKANRVALDQALITMYNKLTDPSSVVRESEYARTPQNLPTINAFLGAFKKVAAGGAGLTDADREALVQGAKIILDERGRTYNDTLQDYQDLAVEYNLDPKLILRGLPKHENYTNEFGKPAGGGGAGFGYLWK